MTKADFVKKIAAEAGITQKQAAAALESALNGVVEAVKAGEKVQFTGFGTFEAKERQARMGLNPATGKKIEIPACKVPSFKAGKSFKDIVKG